jgi:hypothetical protein
MDNSNSLPGCIGYYKKNQVKCTNCEYREICIKVLPREECIKLLQHILEEVAAAREDLKK